MDITITYDEHTGIFAIDGEEVNQDELDEILRRKVKDRQGDKALIALHILACRGCNDNRDGRYCIVKMNKQLTPAQRVQMVKLVDYMTPADAITTNREYKLLERTESTIETLKQINSIMNEC